MYQSRVKYFKIYFICIFLKECDWLSEHDKIEGFEWRGGSERVTSGIQIYGANHLYVKINLGKRYASLTSFQILTHIGQYFRKKLKTGHFHFGKWKLLFEKDLKHISQFDFAMKIVEGQCIRIYTAIYFSFPGRCFTYGYTRGF